VIPENDAISHGEALILQCIICGIILVIVLVASMLDIDPSQQLRDGIRQVLAGPQTPDELISDIRRMGSDWLGIGQPVEVADETTPYETHEYDIPTTESLQPAADDDSSKYTVPEPPDTPGLWD